MGDHRARIHVEFEIHGKTYTQTWDWINYFPDDQGIDQRVIDFFRDSWGDAKARYDERVARWHEANERPKREAAERAELIRLKAKYEPPQANPR